MELSPKVLAYIRASEVIAKTRAEAGMYDRSTAAAINKELKLISDRMLKSARNANMSELITERCKKDPEWARKYAEIKLARRYLSAAGTVQKLGPKLMRQDKGNNHEPGGDSHSPERAPLD